MKKIFTLLISRFLVRSPMHTLSGRLNGESWHEVLIRPGTRDQVVDRIRCGQMSEWCRFMVENTAPGESVLEIASGTGEISLILATLGRRVTLLDLSAANLEFSRSCAEKLGLVIDTVQMDVTSGLHFPNNTFDCTWSSGLLEHFPDGIRQFILQEKARVSSGRVISLVPNAACLAYRIGKADQERRHVWPYGLETPLATQLDDFAAAGLSVVYEGTVGAKHAIGFLRKNHPLFRALSRWINEQSEEVLLDYRQGYLLATVGNKIIVGRDKVSQYQIVEATR